MRGTNVLALWAAIAVAACDRRGPSVVTDASASAGASASSAAAASARSGSAGAAPASAATGAAARDDLANDAGANATSVIDGGTDDDIASSGAHVVVGFDGSAVELWTRAAGDDTEIVGRVLDAYGSPRGGTRRLRRTSGAIASLVATRSAGNLWVSWSAILDDTRGGGVPVLVAVLRAEPDLSKVDAPMTLLHARLGEEAVAREGSGSVAIAPRRGGGALVASVAARGRAACVGRPPGTTACEGPGWDVHGISQGRPPTRLAHRAIDGGPNVTIAALFDVGGVAFASAWAWHGGAAIDEISVPIEGDAGAPSVSPPSMRPPYSYAWNGEVLVGDEPTGYWDEKRGACPTKGGSELECAQLTIVPVGAGGAGVGAKHVPLESKITRCEGGHPVIEYAWRGGKVKLDPARPSAVIHELDGWTGHALLEIAAEGKDKGKVLRRTCRADGHLSAPARP